tara:strand:+ start:925 stop:1212 length:288 start_codon:yes stop_codon:yes gene_type:complete
MQVLFAGLEQGNDAAPVCCSGVVASEQPVFFAVQSYGTNRAFDGIAVHLDAAVSQQQAQTTPLFYDVLERLDQTSMQSVTKSRIPPIVSTDTYGA